MSNVTCHFLLQVAVAAGGMAPEEFGDIYQSPDIWSPGKFSVFHRLKPGRNLKSSRGYRPAFVRDLHTQMFSLSHPVSETFLIPNDLQRRFLSFLFDPVMVSYLLMNSFSLLATVGNPLHCISSHFIPVLSSWPAVLMDISLWWAADMGYSQPPLQYLPHTPTTSYIHITLFSPRSYFLFLYPKSG